MLTQPEQVLKAAGFGVPGRLPAPRNGDERVRITFTCTKCTFTDYFVGQDVGAASMAAIHNGWRIKNDKAVCRRCPK